MAPKEGITDHPVLESPATRIIGLYPPILSRAVHLMSNSCRTTNRTVLVAPETEIIRFWTLQQHGSSGSAPAPLLAASLLRSGHSRILDHPVLESPAALCPHTPPSHTSPYSIQNQRTVLFCPLQNHENFAATHTPATHTALVASGFALRGFAMCHGAICTNYIVHSTIGM